MFHLFDAIINSVTGLGGPKDPTTHAKFHFHGLDRNTLENMYRSDWISRRIVDAPAEDATREWRQWTADQKEIDGIEALERKFDIQRKLKWAITRARLYGGAALVMGVDDGHAPWEELNLDKVTKDSLQFVVVLNRYELNAGPRIYNVNSPYYTRPEYYAVATPMFGFSGEQGLTYPVEKTNGRSSVPLMPQVIARPEGGSLPYMTPSMPYAPAGGGDPNRAQPYAGMVYLHPSRVVELTGSELPDWRLAPMGGGWGDSILQIAEETLKDWGITIGGIAAMVNDAKVDVIHIPDFSQKISNKEYANALTQRFTFANMSKSMLNSIVLDEKEQWERVQSNFSGLPQVLRELMTVVAGAGGIPVSRLMGQAPGRGLSSAGSSGGEQDLRNYYDTVSSQQDTVYRPALALFDQVLIASALGGVDPTVSYDWKPLYLPDPKDVAAVALQKAQTTQIYVSLGLINEDAMREATVAQLSEDNTYPGLEDAIEEFGAEPEEPPPMPGAAIDPKTGKPLPMPAAKPGVPQVAGPPKVPQLPKPKPAVAAKDAVDDNYEELRARVSEVLDYSPNQARDPHGKWTAGEFKSAVQDFLSDDKGGVDVGAVASRALASSAHFATGVAHHIAEHSVKDVAKEAMVGALTGIGAYAGGPVTAAIVGGVAAYAVKKVAHQLNLDHEHAHHMLTAVTAHLVDHFHAIVAHARESEPHPEPPLRYKQVALGLTPSSLGLDAAPHEAVLDALKQLSRGLSLLKFGQDGKLITPQKRASRS